MRLLSDDVSRRHARISADGDGHLLVDLDSTNGTWVNGAAVRVHRLRAGDRVRLGAFVARYVAAGDPEGRQLADLAEATARLMADLLQQFEPSSLLGYRDVEPGGVRVDQPGLLSGAPGVALALLGAAAPVDPGWDRLFLLA